MTGQELRILSGHSARIKAAVFSPAGNQVVTASADNTARVWNVSINFLLAEAVRLIQRDPPVLTPEELRRYGLE